MKKQIKRKIYLLSKRESRPIEVVQYETGIQLVFEVQDVVLDETSTATLFVRKPSGKFVFQEDNISLTGNTVVIDLHNQAITEHGKPFFQIKFKKDEELISTYSGMLSVETSLEDSGAEESKTVIAAFDTFTDEQIARIEEATRSQIDLMKAEVEAKGETVLATIPDDYTEMYNRLNTLFKSVANAIKGTVSGSVVRVDDVSPVEHKPVVKVHGKNIIPFPYSDTTKISNGITFTDNNDGSITANGTATGNAVYYFINYSDNYYINGEVCLSGCPNGGSFTGTGYSLRLNKYVNGSETSGIVDIGNGRTEVFNNQIRLYFVVLEGTTVENLTVRPMLEYGTTPSMYTPYIDPATVTVTADGVNYTPEADGTVEGIPSTALSGGISTDNEGITIECEYNKDTGKVIEKLTNAVVALGGVV